MFNPFALTQMETVCPSSALKTDSTKKASMEEFSPPTPEPQSPLQYKVLKVYSCRFVHVLNSLCEAIKWQFEKNSGNSKMASNDHIIQLSKVLLRSRLVFFCERLVFITFLEIPVIWLHLVNFSILDLCPYSRSSAV